MGRQKDKYLDGLAMWNNGTRIQSSSETLFNVWNGEIWSPMLNKLTLGNEENITPWDQGQILKVFQSYRDSSLSKNVQERTQKRERTQQGRYYAACGGTTSRDGLEDASSVYHGVSMSVWDQHSQPLVGEDDLLKQNLFAWGWLEEVLGYHIMSSSTFKHRRQPKGDNITT